MAAALALSLSARREEGLGDHDSLDVPYLLGKGMGSKVCPSTGIGRGSLFFLFIKKHIGSGISSPLYWKIDHFLLKIFDRVVVSNVY